MGPQSPQRGRVSRSTIANRLYRLWRFSKWSARRGEEIDVFWFVVRFIHVVAGVGWLGEVVTVNFVLLPVLFKARPADRAALLNNVFPSVFRLATVLGAIAGASGLALVLWTTQLQPGHLLLSPSGRFVLVGGTLGALLYAFHVFQESGAEQSLANTLAVATDADDPQARARLLSHLALFPRIGLLLLLVIVLLMVAAAHLP
jgi:amino acid transporter